MAWQRLHLFEFEDLTWFPKTFRKLITDLLAFQMRHLKIYDSVTCKIVEVLKKTGLRTMVDLCSGSGGPAPLIREMISEEGGEPIELILTDKYPNLEVFAATQERFITPIMQSVDAAKVPSDLKGLRTLFTSFHHFKPMQAKQILQDAVDAQMPIGIFEITERRAISLLTLIIAPLTCLIFSLRVRPYKFCRLFWTYIIPVIPLFYTWDGLISNLRTYTQEEWLEMTRDLKSNNFSWEVGELTSKYHIKITYLIGFPKKEA